MKRTVLSGILSALCVPWLAFGQVEMPKGEVTPGPKFFFDAISYRSDVKDKSRIELYLQIPYEEVSFAKEGESYVARFEIVVGIYRESKELVTEQSWADAIEVKDFSLTQSNRMYRLIQRSVDIDPGNYVMMVELKDETSKKGSATRRSLLVTDYSKDSLSLSDIMLVSRLSTEGGKRTVVPNVSGTVIDSEEGFFLYFEIYAARPADSVSLTWSLINSKKEEEFRSRRNEPLKGTTTQSFLRISDLKLPTGTYLVAIEAAYDSGLADSTPSKKYYTSRTVMIRDPNLPVAIIDIDKATEQLLYVAKPSEISTIEEADDKAEKMARFLEFWKKRDPDPSTPRNELMEEYYERVEYANEHFRSYTDGWRTDMGMVFVRFGQPENVERHPFETGSKPYEIWYYYQLNRRFIFEDITGFGEYRMRYPATDLWGRVRDF